MSNERARMIAEEEAKRRQVAVDRDAAVRREQRMRVALEYLASPACWLGDPHSQESTLHGHETPFELAVRVLADVPMAEQEHEG